MAETSAAMETTGVPTLTRPHFAVLDGLRGVAAVAVVTFHFLEMVIWPYDNLWLGHGFLAVDFFFCLSGFVMGYAYNDRLQTMSFWSFLKARLIRLHPLVILGFILGLIAFYANPFGIAPGYNAAKIAIIFATSLLMIPYGVMKERAFNLFGLNAPAWSLFWEYVASIVFGLILFRLRRGALLVLTIASAILLCWVGHKAGNLPGGWSTGTFWDGGARVAFSFLAGLLIYRMGWHIKSRLGFTALSLLLIMVLVSPYKTGAWVREAAIIILYFPLLVMLGAEAKLSPRVERICKFSGDLSYPLYMTHYSVIWIWGDYAAKHKLLHSGLGPAVLVGVIIMFTFGCIVMVFYDKPVRAWLSAKWR